MAIIITSMCWARDMSSEMLMPRSLRQIDRPMVVQKIERYRLMEAEKMILTCHHVQNRHCGAKVLFLFSIVLCPILRVGGVERVEKNKSHQGSGVF